MKKAIAYLLCLVLCMSFLSGCNPKVYYRSYTSSMYADLFVIQQIPDAEYRENFYKYEFWPSYGTENENPPQEIAVKFGDMQLQGEYSGRGTHPGYWGYRSYQMDRYLNKGKYSFDVHRETKELVFLHMTLTNEQLALPDLENPRKETERIAKQWAAECSDDIGAYRFTFNSQENRGSYSVYNYYFHRYINDIPTMDYIEIDITSKGTIDKLVRGELNAFKNVRFDTEKVKESMDKHVRDTWMELGFTVISYEEEQRTTRVCLTMDKQVAVVYELRLQLKDPNGDDRTAGMSIITLVSTDPNGVIATRLNPYA